MDKDFKIKLSTGNIFVIIEPVSGVAFSGGAEGCVINAKNINSREYLDSYIHELYHIICPNASEKEVERIANDLSKVLWKRGYRLRKNKFKK
jgi:hypothetical protein